MGVLFKEHPKGSLSPDYQPEKAEIPELGKT